VFADTRNRQVEKNLCGLACLGRAANLSQTDLDLRWLRQHWPAPAVGLTLAELEAVAGEVGIATQLLECRAEGLSSPVLNKPTQGLEARGRTASFAMLRSSVATWVILTHDRESAAMADRALAFDKARLWSLAPHQVCVSATPVTVV
jgi:hypothetical protein